MKKKINSSHWQIPYKVKKYTEQRLMFFTSSPSEPFAHGLLGEKKQVFHIFEIRPNF